MGGRPPINGGAPGPPGGGIFIPGLAENIPAFIMKFLFFLSELELCKRIEKRISLRCNMLGGGILTPPLGTFPNGLAGIFPALNAAAEIVNPKINYTHQSINKNRHKQVIYLVIESQKNCLLVASIKLCA